MKSWQHVTAGFVLGIVVASTASLLLYKGSVRPETFNGIINQAVAVRARSGMEALQYLERGDAEAARQRMSVMLKFDAQVLSRYSNDQVLGRRYGGRVEPS